MNEIKNKMKKIMIEKGFALLLSAILVITVMAAMPAVVSASDWPEFQVNETNIGRTDDSATTKYYNLSEVVLWNHHTAHGGGYGIDSVPIVVGDYVYVHAPGSIFKYSKNGNAAGGNWPVAVGGANIQNACPAHGEGKIFVADTGYQGTPRLYAITATSGNEEWSTTVGSYQLSCPITYYNDSSDGEKGRVFFGSVHVVGSSSDAGTYYCYFDNGDLNWSRCSGEHIYDFKTGTGTNKWAYGKQVSQNPPPSTNNNPNSVFTTAQYTNISADDQTFQNDTADRDYHAAHRFNFSISENPSSIIKINVTWNGIGTRSNNNHGATLYIWNFSSAEYEQLGSTTLDTEVTLTGEKTEPSNYISSSGNVTVLVVQKFYSGASSTQKSQIKTDYVRVVVCPRGGGYYWAGAAVIGDYLVYGGDKDNLTSVYWRNGTFVDSLNISTSGGTVRDIRSSIAWNVSATNSNYGHIFFTNKTSGGGGSAYVSKIGFNKSTGLRGHFNSSDWTSSSDIKYSTSTPAIYKRRVYVGGGNFSTGNPALLCLNESNITDKKWEFTPNGAVQSSPALSIQGSDVYIYFTTNANNGTVYCLKDGGSSYEEKWKYTTEQARGSGGYILQGVAISDGWVFFGNDGGYLYGINKTDRIHVYDFNDGRGTDKWAYRYQINNANPPNTCDVPSTEFTSAKYGKIKRKYDNMLQKDTTDANDNYAAHRFNFSIDETTSDITAINASWNGKGYRGSSSSGGDDGVDLYIYNFTSGEYGGAVASNNSGAEVTLTWGNESSASNYINSGNVTILVEQKSQDDTEEEVHSHI